MATSEAEPQVVPIWLEGSPVTTTSEGVFPVVNASGRTLHHACNASVQNASHACESSWNAFQSWKRTSFATRSELLTKFAAILERDLEKLIKIIVDETSCPEAFARMTTGIASESVKACAGLLHSIFETVVTGYDDPTIHGLVLKQPIGPVLIKSPWNSPIVLAVRAIAQAITAGCTVVFKASELSPRSHYAVIEALTEAGAPPGLVNSVQARREDGAKITEALIAHKRIRKVDFTGSAPIGRKIVSVCGMNLKPCVLELGGKCPAIVMEDADLENAAALCVQGSMMYHGQMCISTERIIVQEKVAERFKDILVQTFKTMPGVQGSAVNEKSAQHAYDVICDAQAKGHKFLYGKPEFESPTSLAPVVVISPKGSRMEDEETFGPSVSLYVVQDEQEAIDLANESEYGWSAAIHTRDMSHALNMAKELDFAMVHCNNSTFFTHRNSPTGGVKSTGWGRSSGIWGINEFLVQKAFTYKPI